MTVPITLHPAVPAAPAPNNSAGTIDVRAVLGAADALRDPLTGLPGVMLLLDRVGHALQRRKRSRSVFALLAVSLDRFHEVAETMGAEGMDAVLVYLVHRLELCLRPNDSIARAGPGEFLILLDEVRSADDVGMVASRIKDAFQAPLVMAGERVFVSVSVGVAFLSEGCSDAANVVDRARTAVERSRAEGLGRPMFFDRAEEASPLREREQREADLKRALAAGEMVLHFQPIVSLLENRIAGFEALVRWDHPLGGLLPPDRFIPLAEESGLVLPLGRWVLNEACRQLASWHQHPGADTLMMSVNLSALQLRDPALPEHVAQVLETHGLEGRHLKLEITETCLMHSGELVSEVIIRLKALGVQIALDDFGTGYSSLAYLRRFPVDYLKIDRSFVCDLGVHSEAQGIVNAVVCLAHSLGMEGVAEGIETAEQLAEVRAMDCAYAQGYFFARPLAAEAAGALLRKSPSW
jgi:Amt family ammonium transporter